MGATDQVEVLPADQADGDTPAKAALLGDAPGDKKIDHLALEAALQRFADQRPVLVDTVGLARLHPLQVRGQGVDPAAHPG